MPRGKFLTDVEKGRILAYKEENISIREIARRLQRSLCVVQNFLKEPINYGTKKKGGRKPKLSRRDKCKIVDIASNSTISCNSIKANLGLNVSKTTVWRVLNDNDRIIRSKMMIAPRLKPNHIEARLLFGQQNMGRDWKNVRIS